MDTERVMHIEKLLAKWKRLVDERARAFASVAALIPHYRVWRASGRPGRWTQWTR